MDTKQDIARLLRLGMTATAALVLGVGGWAAFTEIAGAVAAPGRLVVNSNVKAIQHPTGGVVAELPVRDGDRVKAGDLVLRLDETVTRSNLATVEKALIELAARRARDEAERDGLTAVRFPADLLAKAADDPETAAVLQGEERLFALRLTARQGQKAQLRQRQGQLQDEIRGMQEQIRSKQDEEALIAKELDGLKQLYEKGLVPLMRVNALERDVARLSGARNALHASIAQARGKLNEVELQILQVDQDLSAEVAADLADIRGKTAELTEKRVAARDQLDRVEIRAPQTGIVHELMIHTVGGVVPAGEPVMLIVPQGDGLSVESRIPPEEIDRITMGQEAVLRFTAFNQRTTPEIMGSVSRIAADVSHDTQTGQPFYTVRIALPPEQVERLGGQKLLPGMPVEGFVHTGARTVASYLTKPLRDHLAKAWRED